MSPNVKAIPLIVLGVLLNAAAQICLKKGLQAAGGMQLAAGPLFRLMLEPWVIAGLACLECQQWHCPLADHPCMTQLPAETLWAALSAHLPTPVPEAP